MFSKQSGPRMIEPHHMLHLWNRTTLWAHAKTWSFLLKWQRSPCQEITEKKKLLMVISPLCYSPECTGFINTSLDWQLNISHTVSVHLLHTDRAMPSRVQIVLHSTSITQPASNSPTVQSYTSGHYDLTIHLYTHPPPVSVPGWRLTISWAAGSALFWGKKKQSLAIDNGCIYWPKPFNPLLPPLIRPRIHPFQVCSQLQDRGKKILDSPPNQILLFKVHFSFCIDFGNTGS